MTIPKYSGGVFVLDDSPVVYGDPDDDKSKHLGPGDHPSGSSQDVHAGDGDLILTADDAATVDQDDRPVAQLFDKKQIEASWDRDTTEVDEKLRQVFDTPEFREWYDGSVLVDEDGLPIPLYHQTEEGNVESIENAGFDLGIVGARRNDEQMPDGVFMKPDKSPIQIKGGAQIPLVAVIKKPLAVGDRKELRERLTQLNPKAGELMQSAIDTDSRLAIEFDKVESQASDKMRQFPRGSEEGKIAFKEWQETTKSFLDDWKKENYAAAKTARIEITKTLRDNGFDGVIVEHDQGVTKNSFTKTIVALSTTQVNSVDNEGTWGSGDPSLLRSFQIQQKHQGPGPHPSGSDQDVHGSGGGGGEGGGGDKLATELSKVEAKIISKKIEEAHAFDSDGKPILTKSGTKNEVVFEDHEIALLKDSHFTHNHPLATGFSDEDVHFAVLSDMAEMRAVGEDSSGQKIAYSLKRPKAGWGKDKTDHTVNAIFGYSVVNDQVKEKLFARIKKGEITSDDASQIHGHIKMMRTIKLLEGNKSKYLPEYERIVLDD